AAGRIRLQAIRVEPGAKTDVEYAGHDGVDAVLRGLVRHELHAGGHLDTDNVGTRLGGLTDDHREAGGRWKRGEGLPDDVLGQDRLEVALPWLVRASHGGSQARTAAIGTSLRSGWLDQLVQSFERRGILGADRRILAARVGSLQRSTHVARQWDRRAAVVRLADEITFGTSRDVASKAVAAEPIDDVDESSSPDLGPVLRHV